MYAIRSYYEGSVVGEGDPLEKERVGVSRIDRFRVVRVPGVPEKAVGDPLEPGQVGVGGGGASAAEQERLSYNFV